MIRTTQIIIFGFLFAVTSAFPWDMNLEGEWLWCYEYFNQFGHEGFFGAYDQASQNAYESNTKFNSMNSFVGFRTINGEQYGIVTGTDASLQWMRMQLAPEIKVNQSITFKAMYQIGYGTSPYGLYANSTAYGTYNPIASGTWTYWGLTAQIPWGILSTGKRPLVWGMGALFDQCSATQEFTGITAFYGPFRTMFAFYPWQGQIWLNSMAGNKVVSTTLRAGPQTGFDETPSNIISYRLFDNDRIRPHLVIMLVYSSSKYEAGFAWEYMTSHNGPGGATSNVNALKAQTYDVIYQDGSIYLKYNNGKFFFNNELACFRNQQHIQPAVNKPESDYSEGNGSRYAPYYNESWKYMAELGVISGPTKFTLFYSWIPGPDRRHGIWIKKQSWENASNGSTFSSTQSFRPYSLLMGYQYGAGLNAIDVNGEGYMTDASCVGGRLDFALASNLNAYGTFFYANRVSKGWGWGCLVPASDGTNGGGRVLLLGQQITPVTGIILTAPQNVYVNPAPSIPDDALGWEISLGADWKLLENFTVQLRGAYWRPGGWFRYACVDKSLAGNIQTYGDITFVNPQSTDGPWGWAINPDREIQPIFGFQSFMVASF